MESGRKPRSLVDMCVQKLIDNLRDLGSVDGVEMELLKRILPHCTLAQLTRVENRTKMDLSPITNSLWKRFYQREFGEEHTNMVIKRMKASGGRVCYTWRELFKAKTEKQKEVEDKMLEKIAKKFQAEKAGSGPSSLSNSNYKSPILKKARIEVNSHARLQSAMQKNTFGRFVP
ncbi:hypothetical protein C2845_PM13G04300 [Panicum miliaceum]|uniref:Transcription elongation factor B polypeptide 3 n=1 Tax=Panicum miliaceum TaxID=4540 RepID=A0A3L6RH27_PANMI|nr:hypothetical protein C2845_PM13G04300 [Panicum miliaceum]